MPGCFHSPRCVLVYTAACAVCKNIARVANSSLIPTIHTCTLAVDDLYADLQHEDQPILHRTSTSQSLGTITNLPGISRKEQETAILQAAVFVEDGINYRSIFHKLDPRSLKVYRIYYSPWVQWSLGLVIFFNLMLAFIEYPTSLSISSDPTIRKNVPYLNNAPCGVTESLEFICLVLFAVDCAAKYYLLGWRRFLQSKWLILYVAMILLSFPDMFISLGFCPVDPDNDNPSLGYTLRIRRFFRPLIFLLSSSIMKKMSKAIRLTLPQIFNVLVLLVLHLYIFTMVGLLIFPNTERICEPNITNSSAANYTDIVDYGDSIFDYSNSDGSDSGLRNDSDSCILILYNCTQQNYSSTCYRKQEGEKYFQNVWDGFVNLTVTLTTANHPDIMMPIYRRNRFAAIYFILFLIIGLFLLFNVLIAVIYNQFKGFFQKSLQSSFFRRRVAYRAAFTILVRKTRVAGRRNLELVSRDLVRSLLQSTKLNKQFVPDMYQRLETMETEADCIRWKQFCQIFDLVSIGPHRQKADPVVFYYTNRALGWIQFIVRHRYFRWYTHVITIINLVLITIELQRTTVGDEDSLLVIYNFCFITYYTAEQVFRLVFMGYRQYFSSRGNLYDAFITLVLFILQLLTTIIYHSPFHRSSIGGSYETLIRLMNIFIVLRLLRVIPHVKQLWVLTNTMLELVKNLRGFAGIMVVVYYLFALLGMELFSHMNVVNYAAQNDCGSYDNLGYYANNFNDFASSIVVLWDIMIVNNWYVFLDKFSRDSHLHEWSKLYFIAWWLVSVVICANLFISLVLETFLIQWEAIQKKENHVAREEEEGRYGDSVMYNSSNINTEGQEVRWQHEL